MFRVPQKDLGESRVDDMRFEINLIGRRGEKGKGNWVTFYRGNNSWLRKWILFQSGPNCSATLGTLFSNSRKIQTYQLINKTFSINCHLTSLKYF